MAEICTQAELDAGTVTNCIPSPSKLAATTLFFLTEDYPNGICAADTNGVITCKPCLSGASAPTNPCPYQTACYDRVDGSGNLVDKYVCTEDSLGDKAWKSINKELGATINALTAKTTPVSNDLVAISDSQESNIGKKSTLSQIFNAVVADGSIGTSKLTNNAVTQPKMTIGTGAGDANTLTLHDLISGTPNTDNIISWNGTNWVPGSVSAASESTAGVAKIATDAEADDGTSNNTIMSPLKVATYFLKKDAVTGGLQVADMPSDFSACTPISSAPTGTDCDFAEQCLVRTDTGFEGLQYQCYTVGAPPVAQNIFNDSITEFTNGTASQTASRDTALQLTAFANPTTSGSPPNKIISAKLRDTKGFILPGTKATDASYQTTFRLHGIAHTITAISCECFGTVSTAPQFKFCNGEDRGDDTCTTNLLSSTETDTITCGTTFTTDSTLNSAATNRTGNDPITLQITTAGAAVDECWIQFTTER